MFDLYFISFLFNPPFFYLIIPRYVMELRLKECEAGWQRSKFVGRRPHLSRLRRQEEFACPVRRMRCLWNDYVLARYINLYSHGYEDQI